MLGVGLWALGVGRWAFGFRPSALGSRWLITRLRWRWTLTTARGLIATRPLGCEPPSSLTAHTATVPTHGRWGSLGNPDQCPLPNRRSDAW